MRLSTLLTEAYILLESKVDFILSNKSIVDKLQNRIKEDHSVDNDTTPEKLLKQFDTYKNISVYLPWVIKQYINKYFLFEDLERVDNELNRFNQIKSKLENKDLNKYTYIELDELLDKYKEVDVKSKRQEKADIKSNEAEVFYESPKWEVIIPKTYKASCIYGANTKWCTASRDTRHYFDDYTSKGPLYIIINKKTGEKRQFHFETKSYMNAKDRSIDEYEFFKKNKELLNAFKDVIPRTNPISWLLKPPSEREQLKAVKKEGYAIKFIKNPSEKVQMAAIDDSASSIKYIKNPSEEVQLAAVNIDGIVIEYIKNPSENVKQAAASTSGDAIKYIDNPSEAVQLAAVTSKMPWSIEYIKNPTEKVKWAAVETLPYVVEVIKNPSEELLLFAVENSYKGNVIESMDNPPAKVQLAAVEKFVGNIEYIKNPTEEVQLLAVKDEPWNIQFIRKPTEKVQLLAVQLNPETITDISRPTKKVKALYDQLTQKR